MTTNGLCPTCVNSIWCPTWAEYKCTKKEVRLTSYGLKQPITCADYKKRGKDFKESKCQCDDCLKNEKLLDEEDEEND